MDPVNVFESICAGFNATPDVCYPDYVEGAQARVTPSSGISRTTILLLISGVIAINLLIIFCYWKYTRREMQQEVQLQVSSIMSQYMAMAEKKDSGTFVVPPIPTPHA